MRASTRWRDDEPRPPGRAVVVDIDGVLSDASGRQHFLNNPEGRRDWRGFFGAVGSDPPLHGVPAMLDLLDPDITIVLLSARPSWVFDVTHEWLLRHGIAWHLLVVRAEDGHLGAVEFKRDVVAHLVDAGFQIELALDDDATIIEMYRTAEIRALYVHSGYYGHPPA
ncbi:MAG: hypothetical protein WEB78_09595 [Ilumatobacteraceae bacterium]